MDFTTQSRVVILRLKKLTLLILRYIIFQVETSWFNKVLKPFLHTVDDTFRDFWTSACYLLANSFFQLGSSLRIKSIHSFHQVTSERRSIRIIYGKPNLEHTTFLFYTNKILNLQVLHRYQLTLHLHQTKKYVQLSRRHNYSTWNILIYISPYHHLTTTQHSVAYQGSISWNRFPVNIRCSSSFLIFKKTLLNSIISVFLWRCWYFYYIRI